MDFRAITYNIHSGIGTDKEFNLARIGDVIRASDADIVGLNEVDCCFHKRSGGIDEAKWLRDYLGMYMAFAPGIRSSFLGLWKKGGFGNVLLSRYPILKAETVRLSGWAGPEEPRSMLKAKVDIGGTALNVGVTHLGLNLLTRKLQVRNLLSSIPEGEPAVVMGDFNAKDREMTIGMMLGRFRDAWQEASDGSVGYTFSSKVPKSRIDYIFASELLTTRDAYVMTAAGPASDHLPLIADIEIGS